MADDALPTEIERLLHSLVAVRTGLPAFEQAMEELRAGLLAIRPNAAGEIDACLDQARLMLFDTWMWGISRELMFRQMLATLLRGYLPKAPAPSCSNALLRLEVFDADCPPSGPPRVVETDDLELLIGRGKQANLQVVGHYVSRQHCRIRIISQGALLEDVGSMNGTYVGGRRLVVGETLPVTRPVEIKLGPAPAGGPRGYADSPLIRLSFPAYESPEPRPSPATWLYTVWYATNRRPQEPDNIRAGFSGQREAKPDAPHYGKCEVGIPKSHQFGPINPSWLKHWYTFTDGRLKLWEIEACAEGDFWHGIQKETLRWDGHERQALVYLHGAGVSFEQAAIRAAQFACDLKLPGVVAFFSWPARTTPQDHAADLNDIQVSEAALAEFLLRLAASACVERVHVIAQGLGNLGLLRALQRIQARGPVRFGQIFLAAPDMDADLFRQLTSAHLPPAQRTTLYVPPKDQAAKLAGPPNRTLAPQLTVVPGIDTVEAKGVDLDALGQGFQPEAAGVLRDMARLLRRDAPPGERRNLQANRLEDGTPYWTVWQ